MRCAQSIGDPLSGRLRVRESVVSDFKWFGSSRRLMPSRSRGSRLMTIICVVRTAVTEP
jgi:hypothetical protein